MIVDFPTMLRNCFLPAFMPLIFSAAVIACAGWAVPANAGGTATIVACPAMHPYRTDVPLLAGGLETFDTHETQSGWFSRRYYDPLPDSRYAKDGWMYEIDPAPSDMTDLVCVYADKSEVRYPLPNMFIRGPGRCDFVHEWYHEDITDDPFISSWPYSLDRKPMAICTFDPHNVRLSGPYEPPFDPDDD
jgi:hypothetical protein